MASLQDRMRERLNALHLSARAASLACGLNGDTVGKILKMQHQSPTLATLEKLAAGLQTDPAWLAWGVNVKPPASEAQVTVDRSLLQAGLEFVLRKAGMPDQEAMELAEIFPEALAGPLFDAVGQDPVKSFQIRWQIESDRSSSPGAPRAR